MNDEEGTAGVTSAWSHAVEEARQQLGFPDPGVTRSVAGVAAALRPERRTEFRAELEALSEGVAFEVFLDHWWTQALADAAPGEEAREETLAFADLAVSLRIARGDSTSAPAARGEELLDTGTGGSR
ncbi:hypothetical protein [Streptomyces johnsoniae]|uniref:Uncharacterized protein n=1 Tax=Streptomyces johnsoniae TaxID=3075532 RepID=A0ABU2S265_9ACTN|nr:hypothetical protein [Streptomyces sp. DSM 41886]MDT0441690.1 hypothetical protein [Streptomyces sp. DSM 41886]